MFSSALRQNTIGLPLDVCVRIDPAVIYPRPAVEKPFFACFTAGGLLLWAPFERIGTHTHQRPIRSQAFSVQHLFTAFDSFRAQLTAAGWARAVGKKRTKHAPPPDRPSRLLRAALEAAASAACFTDLHLELTISMQNSFSMLLCVYNRVPRLALLQLSRSFLVGRQISSRTSIKERERKKSKTNFSWNKLTNMHNSARCFLCSSFATAFAATVVAFATHSYPPPQHSSINLWPYFYALHTLKGCCFLGEFSFQPAVHTKDCLCFARSA